MMLKSIPRHPSQLKNSIAGKFIIYTILFSSLITLLGTSLQLYLDYRKDRQNIVRALQQVEKSHLQSITNDLWVFDLEQLATALQEVLALPAIEYLAVRNRDEVIAEAGIPLRESYLAVDYPLAYRFRGQNVDLGRLHVEASLESAYRRLFSRVLIILPTQAIKTFLVALFMLLFFYLLFGRHLARLAEYARTLDLRHLDQPLTLSRRRNNKGALDELDTVVTAINDMRANLLDDLRQRRELETSLISSEQRYRDLCENMRSGLAVYKPWHDGEDFVVVDFNSSAEKIEQLPRLEVIGRKVTEIFPDIKKSGMFDVFQRVWRTGNAEHFSMSIRRNKQGIEWRENYIYRLPGDEIVAIYDDVTEIKRSTDALRQSEERLNLALKAANQGLYDLNIRTGEAVISPEYATMLGYDPKEFGQETNRRWLDRLHPDDLERVSGVYKEYIAGKRDSYQVEFRQRTKDGGWKWVLSLGKIVGRDNSGTPLRMLGTHTDITDRKRVEEELRRAHDELEERVKERTAELQRTINLMAGREVRMAELKERIRQLQERMEAADQAN